MRPPEEVRREFVRDWLEKAGKDLGAGEHLLTGQGFPESVAFHAQQAAEKYLKAFLWHQIDFPKTHDIARLLDLVASSDPELRTALGHSASLTPYGVAYRYPGDYPEVSPAEASRCIETAMAVREAVLDRLPQDLIG